MNKHFYSFAIQLLKDTLICLFHRWDKTHKKWIKRKAPTWSIGRVYSTTPSQGELHYLRMILYHVPGAVNWSDLKTVNGQQCHTFREACVALGILRDDAEHRKCLEESVQRDMPAQLGSLFCTILVYCEPLNPGELWTDFKESMSDDVTHMLRKNDVQTFNDAQIENETLKRIETELHFKENLSPISKECRQYLLTIQSPLNIPSSKMNCTMSLNNRKNQTQKQCF